MIDIELIKRDEYCAIYDGDNDDYGRFGCNNKISFDSENFIVSSDKSEDNDICAILFKLDKQFIKELKILVDVLEKTFEE